MCIARRAKWPNCCGNLAVTRCIAGIGRTGVVGVIKGKTDTAGRVIGLRADMDALPINEADRAGLCLQNPGQDACLRP